MRTVHIIVLTMNCKPDLPFAPTKWVQMSGMPRNNTVRGRSGRTANETDEPSKADETQTKRTNRTAKIDQNGSLIRGFR
uniref:Uncharacterized protein n=1 Tax=Caenorhabditis japonica TaxID=281687 RepID=A0A8R1IU81_CAEJA